MKPAAAYKIHPLFYQTVGDGALGRGHQAVLFHGLSPSLFGFRLPYCSRVFLLKQGGAGFLRGGEFRRLLPLSLPPGGRPIPPVRGKWPKAKRGRGARRSRDG